ncbi:hypothetical protein N4T77_14595 [Clostridium sp. CX1]|uniref:transglutaminase domain-containing protein n=1 Tax=Clostridium sp. CX1 TaxID=2978346 RepID=UPI0021BE4847|nr:transglutaminase domain-containing protein [Clostridium sp. CX1]MCT8977827.1 hypothetical protein [Clostridium sp. CX1]
MFKKRFRILLGICMLLLFAFFSMVYYDKTEEVWYKLSGSKINSGDLKVVTNYDQYYAAVKDAMLNYDSTLTLRTLNYSEKTYNLDVVGKILQETPQLLGIIEGTTITVVNSIPAKLTLNFKYYDSKENLINKEKFVQQKVDEIVNKVIKPEMKDYEKEAALHDYIVNNAQYDERLFTKNMPKESYTAYGLLANKTGVCQGYAELMDRLLKAVGIESKIIIGEAKDETGWISHAWNIVKIGGEYYHLDPTWNDPVTENNSNEPRYSYFNITDEQIVKNHRWNKNNYPKCTSTTYSFNNLNLVEKDRRGNAIKVVKNYNEFYSSIKETVRQNNSELTFRISNYSENIYDVEKAVTKIYNELWKDGAYSWSHYTDEITNSEYLTVTFE